MMRKWDRLATFALASLLCLMGVGHAAGFLAASRALGGVESTMAESLRAVWLTVSAMFVFFGLTLFRIALRSADADPVLVSGMGVVLALAGAIGLVESTGRLFWLQHVIMGAIIVAIGMRLPRRDRTPPAGYLRSRHSG